MVVKSPTAVLYALTKDDYLKLITYEQGARRHLFFQYISRIPMFKSLSMQNKVRIADGFRVCRLPAEAVLSQQGKPVEWLYLIMSGSVKMTGQTTNSDSTTHPHNNTSVSCDRSKSLGNSTTPLNKHS